MLPFRSPMFSKGAGGGGASDPYFSSVVLLTNFGTVDGGTTFTDDSNSSHTLTAIDTAQTDTDITQFGEATLLLDGASDSVSVPDSADWDLGSDDFTIEGWFRFDSASPGNTFLVSQWSNAGGQRSWYTGYVANNLRFQFSTTGSDFFAPLADAWTPSAETWHHIVFERSGTTFRSYVDGVMIGKATQAGTFFNSNEPLLLSGRAGASASSPIDPLDGNQFDIRITKGVARYDSDSGYTVPTEVYPRS